jgi:hypothetical protein
MKRGLPVGIHFVYSGRNLYIMNVLPLFFAALPYDIPIKSGRLK